MLEIAALMFGRLSILSRGLSKARREIEIMYEAANQTGDGRGMKKLLLIAATALVASGTAAQEGPRLDVVFLLDATGSMGDEIGAVKEKIREMISEIALGDPAPDVRFGIVAYRDRDDEYVTRTYWLTRNIDRIVENLDEIEADGGGDYPESFNEGLHVAVQELNWELDGSVSRLIFLIADAPPHLDYPDDYDYQREMSVARDRGIAIHAIGASGLDREGEAIFREVAEGTEGQFQWLAYEQRYVDQDGEEVVVVVEGRTTTYYKDDETWVVEEGGEIPEGLPSPYYGDAVRSADGEAVFVDATSRVGADKGGRDTSGEPVSTSTNLDDLITGAIKDAASEEGVDYDNETPIASTSWGNLKARLGTR